MSEHVSEHPVFSYEITAAERAAFLLREADRLFAAATNPLVVEDSSIVFAMANLILLTPINEREGYSVPVLIDDDYGLLTRQPNLGSRNAQRIQIKKNNKQTALFIQVTPVAATIMANDMYWSSSPKNDAPLAPLPKMTEVIMRGEAVSIDGCPVQMVSDMDRLTPEEPSTLARIEELASITRKSPIVLF